jgi:hypothetical protein
MAVFPSFFLFLSATLKMSEFSGAAVSAASGTVTQDGEVCAEQKPKNIFDFHTKNITGK